MQESSVILAPKDFPPLPTCTTNSAEPSFEAFHLEKTRLWSSANTTAEGDVMLLASSCDKSVTKPMESGLTSTDQKSPKLWPYHIFDLISSHAQLISVSVNQFSLFLHQEKTIRSTFLHHLVLLAAITALTHLSSAATQHTHTTTKRELNVSLLLAILQPP